MNNIDLHELTSIKVPGWKEIINRVINVILKPDIAIGRLSFIPISPLLITEDHSLVFNVKILNHDLVKPNILLGDVGGPEINVQNIDGIVYRLKRGNFKDFFDFTKPNFKQKIIIPYSSFKYSNDLKIKSADCSNFFGTEITKIYFDFLCHSSGEIYLEISNFRFEILKNSYLDVFD